MISARFAFVALLILSLAACGSSDGEKDDPESLVRKEHKEARRDARGSMTGEGGIFSLGGKNDDQATSSGTAIGVNSYLWRATLDTLSFMPLVSADPFGGTIITDWYEDPKTPGERFKVNAIILDKTLRADGVRVSAFKQERDKTGQWRDVDVGDRLGRQIEDTILTRARQLKILQTGK